MLWIEEPKRFETLRLPLNLLLPAFQGLRRAKGLCSRVSAEGPGFGVWVGGCRVQRLELVVLGLWFLKP